METPSFVQKHNASIDEKRSKKERQKMTTIAAMIAMFAIAGATFAAGFVGIDNDEK